MTQEEDKTSQEELWQEATAKKNYWKFPQDKRVQVAFTDWKLERKDVPDYNDKEKIVNKIEFSATVIHKEDEEPVQYDFTTLSKRFMDAYSPIREVHAPTDTVLCNVKQIGDGNGVQYDIEEITS